MLLVSFTAAVGAGLTWRSVLRRLSKRVVTTARTALDEVDGKGNLHALRRIPQHDRDRISL